MANISGAHISSPVASSREAEIRRLAERKGYILRRAEEGRDLWHIMKPEISSAIYSVSLGNPHSYTLDEAERVLKARRDV